MPQIIVTADRGAAFQDGAVTHRERVNVADFESQHFAAQLVERLGWAVEDAAQVERTATNADQAEPLGDEHADSDRGHERAVEDDDREQRARDERVSAPSPA